jgi:hypothetical protein
MKITSQLLVTSALFLGVAACSKQNRSNLDWEQSRADTTRYAYLEDKDLQDEFYFGASVIGVDDFLSGALNMTIDPITVRLSVSQSQDNASKLMVHTADGEALNLLSFDVAEMNNKLEIDFQSSGNDLQLRGLIDYLGGQYTAESAEGFWVSESAPEVTFIDQDNDTVVVNLRHTVKQVLGSLDAEGNLIVSEELSDHPGDVIVRLWLKRKTSLAQLVGDELTVGAAKEKNIGFFSSDFSMGEDSMSKPIQRMPLGQAQADGAAGITYYLKDFPAEYVDVATKGILAWNEAFPENQKITVEIAPEAVDVGDPRYHVVKWFDNTDKSLPWAGVAKMITDPETGLVISGGVYVQGSTVIEDYKGITGFTADASAAMVKPVGRIGNVDFTLVEGESPVVPYFTDATVDFETYMQGYYQETITHEVGHVMGLRHNFRGTTKLDSENHSASIMDYAPRAFRSNGAGLGYYDVAAIQWAYFGVEPSVELPFCTDEDIENLWDCNQGDFGDVIAYVSRALVDGTNVLTQTNVPVLADVWISSMKGAVDTANKILRLKDQLPADQKAIAEEKLPAALDYVLNATPEASLEGEHLETVKRNLETLKKVITAEEN